MGTTVLECGCSISRSMFGDRECLGMHICDYHTNLPAVREAAVKDVWQVILDNPMPDEILEARRKAWEAISG